MIKQVEQSKQELSASNKHILEEHRKMDEIAPHWITMKHALMAMDKVTSQLVEEKESLHQLLTDRYKVLQEKEAELSSLKEQLKGNEWISVEERLPEEVGEQYIVCLLFMDGSHECITAIFEQDNEWYNLEDKDFRFMNVIKWQPLPKP